VRSLWSYKAIVRLWNTLETIKNRTCTGNCAHAEREEAAGVIASARAATLAADDDEDDLDSVGADEDAEYEAFLAELCSPSD
jgi:hypothetical protein